MHEHWDRKEGKRLTEDGLSRECRRTQERTRQADNLPAPPAQFQSLDPTQA